MDSYRQDYLSLVFIISNIVFITMGESVYFKALTNRDLAAKILTPLIEFEFGFLGDDTPSLVQSSVNRSLIEAIFRICKSHGWTTSHKILIKGKERNLYFRIPVNGFRQIYRIAGPFVDNKKNEWAKLVLEREKKVGGYRRETKKTEIKILTLMNTKQSKWWTIQELCLNLRLLPSTVREGIRQLNRKERVERKRLGKKVFWKVV